MVWTAVDNHEAGSLVEQLSQAILLGRDPALGQDALGRLHHDGQNAARLARLVDDGAVVQVHPYLLGRAVPVERQLLVAIGERAARHSDPHHVGVEIRDLRPAFENLGPEKARMPSARKHRVGIVVDHDPVRPPEEHHGDRGPQHDADRGPEALGPKIHRTDRRAAPVEGLHEGRHLPAPGEEIGRRRSEIAVHWPPSKFAGNGPAARR
ncbi:hypothetical protein DES45_106277 [Microvirga subterranea]|uniref:Uncharacterized protein n=1 Tax=Microvirga subterranea TaxID=186651 RepID=A0A370HIH7_9HYPH|nr:hypothetical protein DES45_106277 [Microvirga subterranea]